MKFIHLSWGMVLFSLFISKRITAQNDSIDWKLMYAYVGEFHDECAVVRAKETDGGNLGVVNRAGKVVLPPKYKQMAWKTNSLLEVVKDDSSGNRVGLINSKGQLLFETTFQSIGSFSKGVATITDMQNSIGLINEEGKLIAPMVYSWIIQSDDHPFLVLKRQKSGEKESAIYADTLGMKIGELTFDDAELFESGMGMVKVNGKYGAVNEKMEFCIPPQFDHLQRAQFGLLLAEKERKYGVINPEGKLIIPCKYKKCMILGSKCFAVTLKTGKVGYLNDQNQWAIPPVYDNHIKSVEGMIGSEKSFLVSKNGKLGMIGMKGQILVPFQYEEINEAEYDPTHFYGIMVKKEGKYGLIDRNGKEITTPIYDAYSYDFDGHGTCQFVLVKKDGQWGCLDTKSGKEVVPTQYDRLEFIATSSPNEDSTIAFIINHLKACKESVLDTVKTWELMERKLETGLWELKEQKQDDNGDELFILKGGKEWNILNTQGQVLNTNTYSYLRMYFHEGFLPFHRNGKWGYLDQWGREVIAPQFETPSGKVQAYFSDGKAWVTKNGEHYYINTKGEKIENQDE